MAMINWDWPGQLKTCQNRIAELEEKIASQKRKIQRLLDWKMNATFAQYLLAIREESLARVRREKHLIETRIAKRAADQRRVLPFFEEPKKPSNLMGSHWAERDAGAAAQPQ
jgi:uncharacterized coiled-coil protein SlyX